MSSQCQTCKGTGKVKMPENLRILKTFFESGASDTLHWDGMSPADLDHIEYMPCPDCSGEVADHARKERPQDEEEVKS